MTVFVGLGDLANATRGTGPEPRDSGRPGSSFIRRRPAWMPWLGPIGLRLAVTASCDASITPIVMDDDGNPLDVGHTTRTIPRRLRRALDARDCGCAFPGCGRPAAWTDGHHIHHWSDCGRNETYEHCSAGSTTPSSTKATGRSTSATTTTLPQVLRPGGTPRFTPPTWIDHQRNPIPAHNRSQLLLAC